MIMRRCFRALGALRSSLAPLALVWLSLHAPLADAHKASDAYLDLRADDASVHARWDIALRDLEQLLGLDADHDERITWSEIRSRREAIVAHALAALELSAAGRRCEPGPVALELARRGDGAYAVLRFTLSCAQPAERVDVGYRLLQGVDPTHRLIVSTGDDAPGLAVLRAASEPHSLALRFATGVRGADERAPAAALAGFGGFFVEGIRHILEGIDHLAFLLALLIPTVALAEAAGRRLAPALGHLVSIVTLFTLAHSITLAMTALQWVSLPSRFVESVIAASVVFAGVHAYLASRDVPGSAVGAIGVPSWLVFAFGLIHGFGFGSALNDSGFAGQPAVAALLGFNLGVEAGQLAMLATAFPLAWALRRARLYRCFVLPALSLLIVLAGTAWLVERAFDLDLRVASGADRHTHEGRARASDGGGSFDLDLRVASRPPGEQPAARSAST